MAKPSDSALSPNFSVVIPMTRPFRSRSGPPLLPGLIAASVCTNVAGPAVRIPLMIPRVTVFSSSPNAKPIAITS